MSGSITDWGWNNGLTDPVIASPFPNEANYFSENGADDAHTSHYTVAIESENAPGASAPGPADQSFPITDITATPNTDQGVATIQVVPYTTATGGTAYSVALKTNLYNNAQPAGAGYFTWYAFGLNGDLDGGALPPPNLADFNVNLLYTSWLPDAGTRVDVTYQGYWNNQAFEIDLDLTRQSEDWGTNTGTLVQSVRNTPGLTDVQLNGGALGLSLIPGVETSVNIDWGPILETLINQGVIAGPAGGWSDSASQAFYVSTEFANQAATQSGISNLVVSGFQVSSGGNAPSATTQTGGDTMFNVIDDSSATVETDCQTGAIVQTLPATAANTMQFISIDGIRYGTNLAAAESAGLDPARLCDYDGNPIGASGQWQMLGLASVQPGASPSYILVDPTTGRWAEAAVQSNGSIDFQNYGDNGNTRVVGIYIDPLVASGAVATDSPYNSQRRFLADVRNDNLSLLGSLYDQENGGMDLMFGVNNTPGVYLRAILFPDGNIQYANYLTSSQLTAWAASHEIAPAIQAEWVTKT